MVSPETYHVWLPAVSKIVSILGRRVWAKLKTQTKTGNRNLDPETPKGSTLRKVSHE